MPKILVVDDDRGLCQMIGDALEHLHYAVEMLHDGGSARAGLATYQYDLIIMDWDIPSPNGIELIREFRRNGGNTPVLMMTGKTHIDQKTTGFDSGADDYLTKPFEVKELILRVRALLKRSPEIKEPVLQAGGIKVDPEKFLATRDGRDLMLTRKEFQLLEFLMRNPDRYFSAEDLLDRVWSMDSEASAEAVRVCLIRLRKKVDEDGKPSLIESVRGIGYKLTVPT